MASLKVSVDHAQQRLSKGHITLTAIGEQWKDATLTNVWVDPITYTVMRQPHQMEDSFWTSNAGNYAKQTVSDYTFTTSGNWENRYDGYAVGPVISGKDSAISSEFAISNATYAANRGWFISFYSYGTDSDYEQFVCGWRSDAVASGSSGVSLRFFASGAVEVWKDGAVVSTGKISGAKASQTTSGWVGVYVLPHRGRELLIVSNQGDGFTTVFDDLPQDWDPVGDEEIIPAGYFWWGLSSGAASVMLAPLTFPASGTIVSQPGQFPSDYTAHTGADVPSTDRYTGWVPSAAGDTIAVSVVNVSGQEASLQVAFTGGASTRVAQVFGVVQGKMPVTADTDASEETEITDYVMAMNLEVPDEPSGVRVTLTVKDAPGLEALVPKWRTQLSRPVKVEDSVTGVVWLDGAIDEFSWTDSPNDELQFAEVSVRDRWRQLEKAVMRCEYPLDKLELSVALQRLLELGGCGGLDKGNIETTAFYLPGDTSPDGNKWALLVRQGDNVADWIRRLCEDYAAPYFYGIVPEEGFVFRSPTTIDGQASDATLYRTTDDAVTGGVATDEVWQSGTWSLKEREIEPEANEVWVTGWDRRTGRAIQAFYRDETMQDATVAPSARVDGWAGEPRLFGLVDAALGNQTDVEQTCQFLADVLTQVRQGYEITGNAFVRVDSTPVWRGDKLTLNSVRGGEVETIVSAFSVEFRFETDIPVRPAQYTLTTKLGRPTFARSLNEMAAEVRERGRHQVIVRRDSEFLRSLPAKTATVIS